MTRNLIFIFNGNIPKYFNQKKFIKSQKPGTDNDNFNDNTTYVSTSCSLINKLPVNAVRKATEDGQVLGFLLIIWNTWFNLNDWLYLGRYSDDERFSVHQFFFSLLLSLPFCHYTCQINKSF